MVQSTPSTTNIIPNQFILEGIDRLGKSTLVQGLLHELGYYLVVHYDKPKKLDIYNQSLSDVNPLWYYQQKLYTQMFNMIHYGHNIIFDRGHLGEVVYAPLYRKYPGDYVFKMEQSSDLSRTRLVLLITSDFSFIQDDGLSHDFSKKEEEQARFIAAFHASNIKDKVMVDVCNGNGGYKTPKEVLAEVLKK